MNQTDHIEIRQAALQGGYTDALTAPMSLMVTQREFWEAVFKNHVNVCGRCGNKLDYKRCYACYGEDWFEEEASFNKYKKFWETNYDSGMEKAMEYLNGLIKE